MSDAVRGVAFEVLRLLCHKVATDVRTSHHTEFALVLIGKMDPDGDVFLLSAGMSCDPDLMTAELRALVVRAVHQSADALATAPLPDGGEGVVTVNTGGSTN